MAPAALFIDEGISDVATTSRFDLDWFAPPHPDGGRLGTLDRLLVSALRQVQRQGAVPKEAFAHIAPAAEEALQLIVVEKPPALGEHTGKALQAALEAGSSRSLRMAQRHRALWRAVRASRDLPDGARSGRLSLRGNQLQVTTPWRLADGFAKLPVLMMDATADTTVLQHLLPGMEPAPRYVVRNEHVRVLQIVDRELGYSTMIERADPGTAAAQKKANAAYRTAGRSRPG